jgi:hypothetical protein
VSFDASFDAPEFDASMADVKTPEAAPAEAAAVEASTDAPIDASADASPSPVVVVVGGAQGYEAGVSVVFDDPTGAMLSTATTDATGRAARVVPAGSSVTVAAGSPTAPALFTFLSVQPGDTIVVADTSGVPTSWVTTIPTVPSTPTFDAGVTDYNAYSGVNHLGLAQLPLVLNITSYGNVGLAQNGTSFGAAYPVLVEALDSTSNVLGFAYSKNNSPFALGDAGSPQVDLGGGAWSTNVLNETVAVMNGPDGGVAPQLTYSEVVDGVLTPIQTVAHGGFADEVQVEAMFRASLGVGGTVVVSSAPPPTTSGTVALDTSSVASEPSFTSVTSSFPSGGSVSVGWTLSAGDLSASTGIVALTTWNATTDGGQQAGTWYVVSPGTSATSLQTPALPVPLAAYAPPSTSTVGITTIYAVDGQTEFPTYGSILPEASLFTSQSSPCIPSTPVAPVFPRAGGAILSFYTSNNGC